MPIERNILVTDSEGPGVGSGVIIGIALVLLAMLLVSGITIYNGGFSFGGHPVTIDVPKVTVSK